MEGAHLTLTPFKGFEKLEQLERGLIRLAPLAFPLARRCFGPSAPPHRPLHAQTRHASDAADAIAVLPSSAPASFAACAARRHLTASCTSLDEVIIAIVAFKGVGDPTARRQRGLTV